MLLATTLSEIKMCTAVCLVVTGNPNTGGNRFSWKRDETVSMPTRWPVPIAEHALAKVCLLSTDLKGPDKFVVCCCF